MIICSCYLGSLLVLIQYGYTAYSLNISKVNITLFIVYSALEILTNSHSVVVLTLESNHTRSSFIIIIYHGLSINTGVIQDYVVKP